MYRLSAMILAILLTPGCQTRELNDPPGFYMAVPKALPKSYRQAAEKASAAGRYVMVSSREVYERAYREGWKNCFSNWQYNTIDLTASRPPYEVPQDPSGTDIQNWGERDGYEECRKMLVRNGAESHPQTKK
jgi:hypothetical protein